MVVYGPSSCTGLFYKLFFSIYVKEIKIATGDDVLSNSRFCLVNWHLGKFGPRPGGGKGVSRSMWELRVGIGPS